MYEEMIRISAAGLVITVMVVMLKNIRSEISLPLSILGAVMLFLMIAGILTAILELIKQNMPQGVFFEYTDDIIKILGIGYIADWTASLCRDSGENSIASGIELAGKACIAVVALPIAGACIDMITSLGQ